MVKALSRQPRNRSAWSSRNLCSHQPQGDLERFRRIAGFKNFTSITHMGVSWCFYCGLDFRAFSFMIFISISSLGIPLKNHGT